MACFYAAAILGAFRLCLMLREGGAIDTRWPAFRRGIGWRLAVRIVLFSSAVTLALTSLQFYIEWRGELHAIDRRFDEIERSYLGSIQDGLWTVNPDQINMLIHGIQSLPDIHYVQIRELGNGDNDGFFSIGTQSNETKLSRAYVIFGPPGNMTEGRRPIGELLVEATLRDVYARLGERAVIILLSQGIKTFFVSTFILVLVHRTVTRHLVTISGYVRGYQRGARECSVTLRREPGSVADELDDLVCALNNMSDSIASGAREREGTLRKLRQQEASLNRAYRHFTSQETAAKLAHEIKQPIACVSTYIQGISAQIKDQQLNMPDLPMLVERMGREMFRIREIVAASQSHAAALTFGYEYSCAGDVIGDLQPLLLQICDDNAVIVDIVTPIPGPAILCNSTNLQQVMINLVRNACEAMAEMPADQRRLLISLEDIGNMVMFQVKDSGPGFPQEIIEADRMLFLSTKSFGFGLGLSIVSSIIENHGGSIEINNDENGGASVKFWIPIAPTVLEGE